MQSFIPVREKTLVFWVPRLPAVDDGMGNQPSSKKPETEGGKRHLFVCVGQSPRK